MAFDTPVFDSRMRAYAASASNFAVHFIAFHVNGTERSCRTKVLACPAADAPLGVHCRYFHRSRVARNGRHHLDCRCRAMACAIVAGLLVGQIDAIRFYPHGMPDLCRGLFSQRSQVNRIRRAYFGTLGTLRSAIAPFVGHLRLHHAQEVG